MRGQRREHQDHLAFQHAADGQDPVAMVGDEGRDAQAALRKGVTKHFTSDS
jgi:phosphoglycolate phosphatase-like HAD superfamily hydrolase